MRSEGEKAMKADPKYHGILKAAVGAAIPASGGLVLSPWADMAGMAAIWATMIGSIFKKSGREIDRETAMRLATAATTGIASYLGTVKIFNWAVMFIPGGIVASLGMNAVINAYFTYRLGKYTAIHLEKHGMKLEDMGEFMGDVLKTVFAFNPGDLGEVVELLVDAAA